MNVYEVVTGWQLCIFNALLMYFSAIYMIILCGSKKERDSDRSTAMGSARPQPPPSPAQPLPKAPAQGGIAGTYDPNYQTLAGVQGDVFGADKKKPAPNAAAPAAAGPQKPAVGNVMAGTYDPNYQTLAGVQGDVFGPDKKKAAPPAAPTPQKPAVGGMAGTYDPNYQTLAGMNADVFGADKKK